MHPGAEILSKKNKTTYQSLQIKENGSTGNPGKYRE